jgi:hypothetical protein
MRACRLIRLIKTFPDANGIRLAIVLGFVLIAFSSQAQYEISGETDFSKKVYNKPEKAIPVDLFTDADFKLYPNPAVSTIRIQTDKTLETGVILTLVDVCGNVLEKKVVEQKITEKDLVFNLSKYANGAYFIGIRGMEGTFVSKKFIKRN